MQLGTLVGKPATLSSVNGLVDSNTGATYSLKGAKRIAVKMMQDAEAKESGTTPVNPGNNENPTLIQILEIITQHQEITQIQRQA